MPVSRHTQTSLSAGEFDPLLWSREDVSFFYNSARLIENAVPLPQGGAKRREGWAFRAQQRGEITAYSQGGMTATAPSGGTAANAIDGDDATYLDTVSGISTATVYPIVRIDLGSAQPVAMVDANNLAFVGLPGSITSGSIAVQSSTDDATWTTRAEINVGDTEYNRRWSDVPGVLLATARYWRLAVLNPGAEDFSTATVRLSEINIYSEDDWTDSGDVGEFSLHRLTATIEDEYVLVFTAGNADVFRGADGVWVASIPIPYTDAQVREVKTNPRLDTMLIYHQDVPVHLIQRLGSDEDWRSEVVVFDSIVEFPFDDATTGGVNEIQYLNFKGMSDGDLIQFEYNGQASSDFVWSSNVTTEIETALEGLDDITSVSVTKSTGAQYTVEFTGVDGNRAWPLVVVNLLTGSGTVEISHKQFGKPNSEDLWSDTRGYPSCGAFYQGRHWMGGFRARPDVIAASRAGDLFDFKEDADPVASSPIVVAPNIDDQITIQNIYPGRHLQIFTSSAEIYVPDEPATPNNIALKTTSRHGATSDVKPVDVQGGTLFVDRNGRALREYLFTDAQQSYSAEPVSLLAGHLMSSPRSLVLRRARDVDEPTLLLIANTGEDRNGDTVPAAMCVIDRAQQVTGFFRVKTDGTPLEFASTQSGAAFAMVRRELAGVAWNYLEQFDDGAMSDCSVSVSGSGSTIDLSAYPFLEGQELEVHIDGLPIGAFTVSGAVIDLGDFEYAERAEAGLRMVPRIILHPYKGRGDISPTMQNMRIFRALLQLERTGAVAMTAADGGRPRQVPFQNFDSGVMDPTLEEVLFTGPKRISGLGAWQKEPTIEITQIEPMPFLMRSISYDVRY